MKILLSLVVALALGSGLASAEKADPKTPDSKIVMPVAKIVGPSTAATGRMVILKTTGSLGDDPQITCTPANTNWYVVRFADNTLGVVFDTDQPGTYIFALGVNKSGRTAVVIHVVVVGGVAPPAPAAKLDLSEAFAKDKGNKSQARLLSQCYKQSKSSLFGTLKTTKDLQDAMHELIGATLGTDLIITRQAIGVYVISKLGSDANAAFDAAKVGPVWDDIAAALDKL